MRLKPWHKHQLTRMNNPVPNSCVPGSCKQQLARLNQRVRNPSVPVASNSEPGWNTPSTKFVCTCCKQQHQSPDPKQYAGSQLCTQHCQRQTQPRENRYWITSVLSENRHRITSVPSENRHRITSVPNENSHRITSVPSENSHRITSVPNENSHRITSVPSENSHRITSRRTSIFTFHLLTIHKNIFRQVL